MGPSILALNAGSSCLRFGLFATNEGIRTRVQGEICDIDGAPHLIARGAYNEILSEQTWAASERPALPALMDTILCICHDALGADEMVAAGHRVVHGGADYLAPLLITPLVLDALETLSLLDPLHMHDNLAPMRAMFAARPQMAQVACFDSAFHHSMPRVAALFGAAPDTSNTDLRRYGFHGLSYDYITAYLGQQSPELTSGRVIVAHLASDAPQTGEALDILTYRIASEIGTITGALGGLDGLVFTDGAGENAGYIRAAVCERLAWLGLRLDNAANMSGHIRISAPESKILVRVIATNEEAMIARHTREMLDAPAQTPAEPAVQ